MQGPHEAAAALILAAFTGAAGAQTIHIAEHARTDPVVRRIVNIGSGQTVPGTTSIAPTPGRPGGVRGVPTVVFDALTSTHSSAHMNVAYLNAGSYDGSDPSTAAFVVGLAERGAYRAPSDQGLGFPAPTDILWNDYACDLERWPGGATGPARPLSNFDVVVYLNNTEPPAAARTDTLRVEFFSVDGTVSYGGFDAAFEVAAGQLGYSEVEFDLSSLEPPIMVPHAGQIMLDWVEPGNAGVGVMFTGGDLENPAFPRPETLWTMGMLETGAWNLADGVTGVGGPPARVDPAFDGDPESVSALDILNTGALANWQYSLGNPPIHVLAHDFACRIAIGDSSPACPCDLNGSGDVNSQDLFDFLAGFFEGDADFDGSGETNSQDYFAFLTCFFGSC